MGKIQVMLVDDQRLLREGLKQLLEFEGDIDVIGEANDGIDCLQKMEKLKPDIILLDIKMPNMDGLTALDQIKRRYSNVKVIMLTISNDIEYLLRAYENSADGYVLKESGWKVLKKAIRVVYNGEKYIEPIMVPRLREELGKDRKKNQEETLSKREFEVIKLVAKGMYNKEIATQLNISEKTVKNHMSSIFKKINVSDRTQAAVYAIKNNYINLE